MFLKNSASFYSKYMSYLQFETFVADSVFFSNKINTGVNKKKICTSGSLSFVCGVR